MLFNLYSIIIQPLQNITITEFMEALSSEVSTNYLSALIQMLVK